jgi:hypothetical protein
VSMDRLDPASYRLGGSGAHVAWLVRRLRRHGYRRFVRLGVRVYSPEVRAGVRQFQRDRGWEGADADGMPGPETLRLLAGRVHDVPLSQTLRARAAGLHNVRPLAIASTRSRLPFYAACALMEKESGGRNIYGHDRGGVFTIDGTKPVTRENWLEFRRLVVEQGRTSNGVGPAQITYRGFFPLMEAAGLRPWVPVDNMLFGCRLLRGYFYEGGESWVYAGRRYNGAEAYGVDLARRVSAWRSRLS